MTLTDTRPRERRIENTGPALTGDGRKFAIKKTPNVDGFIKLLRDNPFLTGEADLSAASDPAKRMEMARCVIACAGRGNTRVNDCLMAVIPGVPAGMSAREIVDGVLERAVAAD